MNSGYFENLSSPLS